MKGKENFDSICQAVGLVIIVMFITFILVSATIATCTFFNRVWVHVNTPYPQAKITGHIIIMPDEGQPIEMSNCYVSGAELTFKKVGEEEKTRIVPRKAMININSV